MYFLMPSPLPASEMRCMPCNKAADSHCSNESITTSTTNRRCDICRWGSDKGVARDRQAGNGEEAERDGGGGDDAEAAAAGAGAGQDSTGGEGDWRRGGAAAGLPAPRAGAAQGLELPLMSRGRRHR